MMQAMRAEVRKLYTVYWHYIVLAAGLVLSVGVMAFYGNGYRDSGQAISSPNALMGTLFNAVTIMSTFAAFSAILSMGHEYRYNTILYSLTSTNNRLKLFFAKWIVLVLYTLAAVVLAALGAWLAFYMGQHSAHIHTMVQSVPIWPLVWRGGAAAICGVSYAYLITALIRSQIGAIVIFLLLPSLVEGLLTPLLRGNNKYLPFTALDNITGAAPHSAVSATASLQIVILYVAVAGALAAFLFTERDAN